ncbi:MAG: deoxyribodipyrimidine photo-lyase [Phycisphaerales bacterium]|nr:deoxyribodipyrimidine photo-lyase [Phycisphaerales bacterium]
MCTTTIVWFRQDLRLDDHPALAAAARRGRVVPLFVWAPEEEGDWPPGAASRWWLHHSLHALAERLRARGLDLIVRRGPTPDTIRNVARAVGAGAVHWNRRYEPAIIARDQQLKKALREDGIEAESFNGSLLAEPWQVQTKEGTPYQVFTPFWKTCLSSGLGTALLETPSLEAADRQAPSLSIDELELLPRFDWASGMRTAWTPGEAGAVAALNRFLDEAAIHYKDGRDRPDHAWTSRLSPHLHWGEISIRRVWAAVDEQHAKARPALAESLRKFLSELGWREFAHHLLYHFPHTPRRPLREAYEAFPWRQNASDLQAWKRGRTGYPLVDAGMRELWATGWMHNRVRMVAASFLVKHLVIPWQLGAGWFWDTLVDADLANNTLGWQWTAGCGADAAPYFRIFNPIAQGERFDPEGAYVRRWVPELAALPAKHIHSPWTAPEAILKQANVRLGSTYPQPIVEHAFARSRALEALQGVTKG